MDQIDSIKKIDGVSVSVWERHGKKRFYVNIDGNGGNYRGERNTKVYIDDTGLHVNEGSGSTSREFDLRLESVIEAYNQGA